jgi:excisionase family DNA binding protein
MSTQLPANGFDPLLSIEDLAAFLGVPVATICDWRVDGKGPCGVRVGRHVRFTRADVLAWVDSQRELRPGHQLGQRHDPGMTGR